VAWQGKAGQGVARQGKEWQARLGKARRGVAWLGMARQASQQIPLTGSGLWVECFLFPKRERF